MADIVLFHHAQGLTDGVRSFADLLREAGRKALMSVADGDIEGWSNPDTGAYGTIQPQSTEERGGRTCRRTLIYNNAGGASGTSAG